MFEQRSAALTKDIYTAMCADFKIFDTKFGKVGIAQIEAYGLKHSLMRQRRFPFWQELPMKKDLAYASLMVWILRQNAVLYLLLIMNPLICSARFLN